MFTEQDIRGLLDRLIEKAKKLDGDPLKDAELKKTADREFDRLRDKYEREK